MRVLVTGSRELDDPTAVFRALHKLRDRNQLIVRHGGAGTGADAYVRQWCEMLKHKGVVEERRPADWDKYGKGAGMLRNQEMVTEGGIDLVLAFPRGEARGTMDCVEKARKAGLKVVFG